ncbi:hypothetical protein GLYMA_04G007750v4 [Glycine max]|nr:hypothetical protein GLYMA_04G007750v4 [Glycine max]KAH1109192.1 hypothetical protein GYH30_008544 [Glycine max]
MKNLDHFEKIFLLDYWRYYHGDIQQQKLLIDIIETKPANAISIIETDCEVDFTPPLDYKELKKPTTASKTLEKDFFGTKETAGNVILLPLLNTLFSLPLLLDSAIISCCQLIIVGKE